MLCGVGRKLSHLMCGRKLWYVVDYLAFVKIISLRKAICQKLGCCGSFSLSCLCNKHKSIRKAAHQKLETEIWLCFCFVTLMTNMVHFIFALFDDTMCVMLSTVSP